MNTVVDPECFDLDPDLIVEKKKKCLGIYSEVLINRPPFPFSNSS
jgi:hypothetical protein